MSSLSSTIRILFGVRALATPVTGCGASLPPVLSNSTGVRLMSSTPFGARLCHGLVDFRVQMQRRVHRGNDGCFIERFVDMALETGLPCTLAVRIAHHGGHGHHGHGQTRRRCLAIQFTNELESIHPRHPQIAEHQVGLGIPDHVQPLAAASRDRDFCAEALKRMKERRICRGGLWSAWHGSSVRCRTYLSIVSSYPCFRRMPRARGDIAIPYSIRNK